MIVFDLVCEDGHKFEEWFSSSSEFHAKGKDHDLRCPQCGNDHITQAISAARINGGGAQDLPAAPCGLPQCGSGACAFSGD